jgi:hypothetical protein
LRSGGTLLAALCLLAGCSPAPQWVAVAGGDGAALLLFSPDLSRTDTIPLHGELRPGELVLDHGFAADGNSLFVLLSHADGALGGGALLRVPRAGGGSAQRELLTSGTPRALAVLPTGREVLVAATMERDSLTADLLQFVPVDGTARGARVPVCPGELRGTVPFDVLHELYVVCAGDAVAEVDTELRVAVRTVDLPGTGQEAAEARCDPTAVGLSANGTLVFVLCRSSGQLLYLDRVRLTVLDSVEVGSGGTALALTPGRDRGLIARTGHDELLIVDFRRRAVTHRVELAAPRDPVVSSDGKWAYVLGGSSEAPSLHRLELRRGEADAQAMLPPGAGGVDVWPGHKSPVMRWRAD